MDRELAYELKLFEAERASKQLATKAAKARMGARDAPFVRSGSKGIVARVTPAAQRAGGAHASEARHLIEGLFSLAHDVVMGVAEGTRSQISQSLRAGTSALAPPGIVAAGRVPRGHSVEVLMIVENTTDATVSGLHFRSSPLVAPGRVSIPADAVIVTPENTRVEAEGQCHLLVTVKVPAQAPTGRYVGSLEAEGPPRVQATVTVDVV